MKRYDYTFLYRKCQDCTSRSRCSECDVRLAECIDDIPDTKTIAINTSAKTLSVESDLDEMDLLDEMELSGIFAD